MTNAGERGDTYLERHGSRGEIVFNRPHRRNALSGPLVEIAHRGIDEFVADDAIDVILLRGEGATFCAGADIKAQRENPRPAWMEGFGDRWAELHGALYDCPKPIIGAVEGFAVGGGAALALACDVMFVGVSTQLQLIEVSIGMPAPVNLAWLDIKYRGIAPELVLSADRYSGPELVERGLAARVVADDAVLGEARAYADHLGAHPRRGLVAAKATMRALDGIENFGDRVKMAQAAWSADSGQAI
ncbi:MAG TPA: enoyl-CoA hydratase/isomerase family protein [Dehalococcoidia bacterium]|jgi:enoyl-CoA hydratase|nr:enoyl-CoA hydratase/isomerase family protein [Dehalococcoidia bacterium]